YTVCSLMDRPEQIRGPSDVSQRQLEEQGLARLAFGELVTNGGIVRGAVPDGVIKDRRIRREPCHRKLADVAVERAAFEQVSCNIVEPDALAQIVQQLGRFHRVTSVFMSFGRSQRTNWSCVMTGLQRSAGKNQRLPSETRHSRRKRLAVCLPHAA